MNQCGEVGYHCSWKRFVERWPDHQKREERVGQLFLSLFWFLLGWGFVLTLNKKPTQFQFDSGSSTLQKTKQNLVFAQKRTSTFFGARSFHWLWFWCKVEANLPCTGGCAWHSQHTEPQSPFILSRQHFWKSLALLFFVSLFFLSHVCPFQDLVTTSSILVTVCAIDTRPSLFESFVEVLLDIFETQTLRLIECCGEWCVSAWKSLRRTILAFYKDVLANSWDAVSSTKPRFTSRTSCFLFVLSRLVHEDIQHSKFFQSSFLWD